ncbi:MAG: hypothetical protein IT423_00795, partial [Pirellulaceae bacterium]|nr:hypothetical protein [Pirellulaceae bacterium]
QETIPSVHPNGYRGPGMDIEVSAMREGFNPESGYTPPGYIPASSAEGASYLPHRPGTNYEQLPTGDTPMPSPTRVAPGLQLPTPPPSQGSNSWETKRIK